MNGRIPGHYGAVTEREVTALKIGDCSARLADEERPGREIPGGELQLPEPFEPSRSDIRQSSAADPALRMPLVARMIRANWAW